MTQVDPADANANPARRTAILALVAAAVATVALVLIGLTAPFHLGQAVRWYCVALGAIASVALIRLMFARYPVAWQAEPWPEPLPARSRLEEPPRLRVIRRAVARAGWDSAGFRSELRPVLRGIAAQRLATYRRINLQQNPVAAREVLGERAWSFLETQPVNTGCASAADDLGDLRAAVEVLEGLRDYSDR